MSFDECLQLLAETFPLEEVSGSAASCGKMQLRKGLQAGFDSVLVAAEPPRLPGDQRGVHDVSGAAGSAAAGLDPAHTNPAHTDPVPGPGADLDGDPVPPRAAGRGKSVRRLAGLGRNWAQECSRNPPCEDKTAFCPSSENRGKNAGGGSTCRIPVAMSVTALVCS